MYTRVLVPVDGSVVGETAVEAAVELCRRFDADLHAIYAVETEPFPVVFEDTVAALVRRGRQATEEAAEVAAAADVDVTTAVLDDGEPAHRAILEYASEVDADLLVMGTHGLTGFGRLVLGSVAEQTLRGSGVPVMTVHAETAVSTLESILVPFDGSTGSSGALAHARELALATDATVHLLSVVDHAALAGSEFDAGAVVEMLTESSQQALDSVVEELEHAGVAVGDATVRVGSPSRTIVDVTESADVDCVVMGTHGRTGVGRVLLGSVTERVVRRAGCPVVAVPVDDDSE